MGRKDVFADEVVIAGPPILTSCRRKIPGRRIIIYEGVEPDIGGIVVIER